MLDHFGFYIRDAANSLNFYRACLAPLGIDVLQEQFGGKAIVFKRPNKKCFLWVGEADNDQRHASPGRSQFHLGFAAASPAEVDSFYAAAIKAGGTDNGGPGWRNPSVYAAFVFDPDGNNIEADYRPG
jgi:catechol 2,3-dioxygenase-like lactoylglutathione lyase family enzyme